MKVKVWVYYNPTTSEVNIYENEPPGRFGRRQYDIGPIELEEDLIAQYVAAKDTWYEAHAKFVNAVKKAYDRVEIDWPG